MIKWPITYTDYNGVTRTEDFWFNYSKAELMEKQLGVYGGFSEMVQKITEANDQPELIRVIKEFVLKAYGEKSHDGKRFIKSDELSTAFSQTEAYSVLFMDLATNAKAASKFVVGCVPADMAKDIEPKIAELNN